MHFKAGDTRLTLYLNFDRCDCIAQNGQYITISPLQRAQSGTLDAGVWGPARLPSETFPTGWATQGQERLLLAGPHEHNPLYATNDLLLISSSGQPPNRTGDALVWTANDAEDYSATYEDLDVKDASDQRLFFAGILWGLSGAAIVALWPEDAEFARTLAERRSAGSERMAEHSRSPVNPASAEPPTRASEPPPVLKQQTPGISSAVAAAALGAALGWGTAMWRLNRARKPRKPPPPRP